MGANLANQVKQLQATLTKMEVALKAIADAVVFTNKDQQVQWCNKAFAHLVNQPHSSIIGSRLIDLLPLQQGGQPIAPESYPDISRGNGEYEFHQGDRSLILQISASWVELPEGDSSAVLVIQNLTQIKEDSIKRKRVEESLRESEERLRTLINATPDIICFKDGAGRFLEANQGSLKFLQLEGVDYKGKTDAELAEFASFYRDVLQNCDKTDEQAWQRQAIHRVEEVVPRPDSTVSILDMIKIPLFYPDGRRKGLVVLGRDISDRKRAEEALQASEAQYRDLVQTANCIILRWDTQGNIQFLNEYGQHFLGYDNSEIIGRNVVGTIVPESETSGRDLQALMANICQHPENYLFNENENICKNGDRVWIVWANKPSFDEQGNLIEILSVGTDATERKQAQAALENSWSLLRATFESIKDGILAIDCSGNIISYNQKFLEMWSIPPQLLAEADPIPAILHLANQLKDADGFLQRLRELKAVPKADSYDLLELKDGRVFERYSCPQSLGEKIIGRVWSFREITARKRAEEALRRSELKYRNIFENSHVGIFRSRIEDGLILDANQRFIEVAGYSSPDEVIGKKYTSEFYVNPSDRQWVLNELRQHGVFNDHEIQCRKRDGSLCWVLFSIRLNLEENCAEGVLIEITDRKRAEEALQASEAQYRDLVQTANCMILRWDSQGNIRFLNEYGQRFLGYDKSEILGRNVVGTIVPESETSGRDLQALMVNICQHPENYLFNENENICKNGDRVWIVWANKPIFDEQGNLIEILSVGTDATERKQAQAALENSLSLLRATFESIKDGILAIDCSGNVISYNQKFLEMWSIPPELLAEKNSIKGILYIANQLKDPDVFLQRVRKLYADPEVDSYDLLELLDGRIIERHSCPQRLGEKIIGRVCNFREITARKRAESALKESEAKFRSIVESANDIIYLLNPDGVFLYLSPNLFSITGFYPSELEETSFMSLIHPEDLSRCLDAFSKVIAIGQKQSGVEYRVIHKDGSWNWYIANIAMSHDAEGNALVVGVSRNINDRKHAEETLREAKEAAEAANRAKSAFLANMSHELRTPLNAILGFAQLMERDSALTSRQGESLAIINRSGEHLLNLIDDVLEMSKIEAGRIVLNASPFDLHRLLQTLEEMFQVRAKQKQLSLQFAIAPDLPRYILTDEGKLRQVLINLLGNAVKFTQTGGVTLRVRRGEGENVELNSLHLFFEVEDTGRGIAPAEMNRLFQPFVQTASGTQAREGTGLGLAISREFVRLMGGDIYLSSIPEQGSIFSFNVQVGVANPSKEVVQPTARGRILKLAPNQPLYRILVVDDRLENRELIRQLLETVGFEIHTASNGQEAIAQWQSWQPHLIWMDMRMPLLDGYEATREIRARETQPEAETNLASQNPHTVIIALTASVFEEQQANILAAGCDDFVRKPFRQQLIFEKIAQYLGVQYIYAEDEENTKVGQKNLKSEIQNLISSDLTVMPTEWVAQLHQAALEVDADQIFLLIKQIPNQHQALAEGLAKLVHHFCFDEILALSRESR